MSQPGKGANPCLILAAETTVCWLCTKSGEGGSFLPTSPERSQTGFGARAGLLKERKVKRNNYFQKPVSFRVPTTLGTGGEHLEGSLGLSHWIGRPRPRCRELGSLQGIRTLAFVEPLKDSAFCNWKNVAWLNWVHRHGQFISRGRGRLTLLTAYQYRSRNRLQIHTKRMKQNRQTFFA